MCAFPTLLVQSIAQWRKATLLHTVLQCTVHTAHWRKAHSIAQWRKGIAWDRLEQLYLSGTLANSTVYILLSTMCGVWKHPSIIHKWSGRASSRSLNIYIQKNSLWTSFEPRRCCNRASQRSQWKPLANCHRHHWVRKKIDPYEIFWMGKHPFNLLILLQIILNLKFQMAQWYLGREPSIISRWLDLKLQTCHIWLYSLTALTQLKTLRGTWGTQTT